MPTRWMASWRALRTAARRTLRLCCVGFRPSSPSGVDAQSHADFFAALAAVENAALAAKFVNAVEPSPAELQRQIDQLKLELAQLREHLS